MITKEQFEKLVGVKLIEQDGKLVCKSYLDLEGRKDITELPDNLTVLSSLDLKNSGVNKLPKGLEVECWLDISGTDIKELPEDTKFGRSLYVNEMKKPFAFPKVVKVNDYFKCKNTTIKRMPEELYVKYHCYFSGSTFDKLPEVMEVGESLILQSTPITELPKGLKEVYGRLDIRHTKVSKLPDNLVVYRWIELGDTQIEELPKSLFVGSWLDLRETNLKDYSNLHKFSSRFVISEKRYEKIKDSLVEHNTFCNDNVVYVTFKPNYKGAYLFENENGKYIGTDYPFAKIIKQKGNVYHIQRGRSGEITYLITDGEGHWAHGRTLEEVKDELIFKINERDKSDYKHLSLDSELSFGDAIMCYRVIINAYSLKTKDFIENRLGKNRKDKYTVKEIVELTENEVFKDFFRKEKTLK